MADGSIIIEIKGDDSELQDTLNGAGEQAESALGNLAGKLGKMFAAKKIFDTVVKLGKAVYQTGSEFESAFAQVQTIMDTSQMSVKDMESAIRSLSKETGVSAADLSATVYSAISATGDTANAVKLTADATKLAAAGFTDTDSALSVLTTTMNAYHLSAEEAANISDSLIMTQNLGVTTVKELAAGMGKAIAMGSAFGVDLYNLESAYISTTKAGIGTAESTTYISSMIKELGDSGSQVAKVLQNETGQSFGQLMESGMSLGDVLGVLLQSVDGDAAALQNLWSSAEAGLASSAIVGQGLDVFNEHLGQVAGSAGATQTAYETMANTMEHKTALIREQAKDMAISLYEAAGPALGGLADGALKALQVLEEMGTRAKTFIAPMIDGIKDGFQRIRDAINNAFTPEQQAAIGNFLKTVGAMMLSIPFAQAAAVVEVLANAFELVCGAIEKVKAAFAAVPGVIEGVKTKFTEIGAALEPVKTAISTAVDAIREKFTAIGQALAPVREAFSAVVEAIGGAFDGLKEKVQTVLDGITAGIDGALGILSHLPGKAGEYFAGLRERAGGEADGFTGVGGKIAQNTQQGVESGSGGVRSAVSSAIQSAVDAGIGSASGGAAAGQGIMTSAAAGAAGSAGQVSSAAASGMQGAVGAATGAASGGSAAGAALSSSTAAGVSGGAGQVSSAATGAVTSSVAAATGAASAGTGAGSQLSSAMGQGVRSGQGQVSSAATGAVTSAISSARGSASGASSIGSAIASGIAGGIRSGAAAAISAAASLARSALSAAKAALGIASPSKEFFKVGVFTVQGFVRGVDRSNRLVRRAMDRMTGTVTKEIQKINEQIEKIEADAAERQEKKEFEEYQKSLAEKQAAVDKAKAADRQKALDDLQKLQDDWNEKQLQKQEAAQKKELESQRKALEDRQDALEDFQKEYEDTLEDIRDRQEDLADKLGDFDLLAEKTTKRGTKYNVLANLDGQTRKIEHYGELLEGMKDRGASRSLLDEILSMNMDDAMEYMTLLKNQLWDNDKAWADYLRSWEEKEEAADRISRRFFADQVKAVGDEYDARLREEFSDLMDTGYQAGQNVVKGLINGMKASRSGLAKTAAALGNDVRDALQTSLDEHSPSRVTAEIGRLAGTGLEIGLRESALSALNRFRQEVEAEVQRLGAGIAARAESAGRLPSVTREIHNNTHTVDRIARLEGDGLTGEFIRMLNLRLKEDDRRLGLAKG